MTNSSNSSSGVGNTKPPPKQISPAKKWCFTAFKTGIKDMDSIINTTKSSNSSSIIGFETCPETKTKHLQCYIEFPNKVRPKNLFEDLTIHFEKAKGSRIQNINYCSKEEMVWTNFIIAKPLKN